MAIVWQSVGPALIAGVLMLLVGRLWRGGARELGWVASLAVGIGAGASYMLIRGWPAFPPAESTSVVPYAAVAAGIVGVICARWLRGLGFGLVGAMGVGFAAFWLITRNLRAYSWEGNEAAYWLSGMTVGVGVLWLYMRGQCLRWGERSFAVGYGIWMALLGAVLAASGSLALGQLAGGVAAALGGVFVVTLWRREVRWTDGVVMVMAVTSGVLLSCGYHFSVDFKWYVGVMVLVGPLLGWVSQVRFLRGLSDWKLFSVRVGLVVMPVVGALVTAYLTRVDDPYAY